MEFQEFLTKQEEVYQNFKNSEETVRKEGIKAHDSKGESAYFIAFRHLPEIAEKVEEFSLRIARELPSLTYMKEAVHTTISDYNVRKDFTLNPDILRKLSTAVYSIREELSRVSIDYTKWLYNQDTLIAAGMPNESFLRNSEIIRDAAVAEGLELRLPWGAHITTARFEESLSPDSLSDFYKLMQEAVPIGNSIPFAIDIGVGHITEEFELNTYERFQLNKS